MLADERARVEQMTISLGVFLHSFNTFGHRSSSRHKTVKWTADGLQRIMKGEGRQKSEEAAGYRLAESRGW
jgi:hypothetical protein